MNKVRLGVMVYGIVVILVFGLSLHLFARIPYDCEGLMCQSYARSHCDRECNKMGWMCMGDPMKVYGACIGVAFVPYCHSIWNLRCENGRNMGQISCYDYDPRCY